MKRAFAFLAAAAVCVVGYVFLLSLFRGSPYDVGSVVAALLLAVALGWLNRRFFRLEGRSLAEIGFDRPGRRARESAVAFLAGCGLVALWALALALILSARWRPYAGFNTAGGLSRIAFCLFNNAGEELAYRGYLLTRLVERFGRAAGVLSTAALFALLHVQAGLPWMSALSVVFTCGVLFAVLRLRWSSLPLVIGFHVATNVGQELIGLRITDLTLLRPTFGAGASPVRQMSALGAAGLINVAIVLILVARLPKAETFEHAGRRAIH
jgi:membrane protease YdiL (CAAX protease family)